MDRNEILEVMTQYHRDTDDNVVGVTYGYKTVKGVVTGEKSIIFTVLQKLPKTQLSEEQLLPKHIQVGKESISTDVVQGRNRLLGISDCNASFYTWRTTPPTNRNEQRPLDCGISISNWDNQGIVSYDEGNPLHIHDFVGTLGLLAIDNETNSLVGVTNNHVVVYDAFICSERTPVIGGDATQVNNVKGDDVTQPNESLAHGLPYSIGKVKRYWPIRKPGAYPFTFNFIDAALVTIDDADDINYLTSWHQHGLTPPLTYPWASPTEINNLSYGDPVQLFSTGRTTGAKGEGLTKLRFSEFGTMTIPYTLQGVEVNVFQYDIIKFIATLTATGAWTNTCYDPISGGDSGSALIANIGGVKKVIGLVFAGTYDETEKIIIGVACRIDYIAALLDIREWNGEAVSFSNPSATMEIAVNGLDDRDYINYGGKKYWQVGLRNIT